MTKTILLSSLSPVQWRDLCARVHAAWPVGKMSTNSWVLSVAITQPAMQESATELGEVAEVVKNAEKQAQQGHWVVCSVAYESAPAFDSSLTVSPAIFGEKGEQMPQLAGWQAFQPSSMVKLVLDADFPTPATTPWLKEADTKWFDSCFAEIKTCIGRGDFYQINLTERLGCQLEDDNGPANWFALFCRLYLTQPVAYALYMRGNGFAYLSLSPELFFEVDCGKLMTRPMKGTRSASHDWRDKLSDNPKDRAENVMIVDLLRNDMARVCKPRSVQVASLFDVMHLPTVEQMTSTIQGELKDGVNLLAIFQALFPCGSVTGAPKAQAMKQIASLETSRRGIYCGALGLLYPGGRARFNVPIRTVYACENGLRYGVGSGITWYSSSQGEFLEWHQKTRFLRKATGDFSLLETVRLEHGIWVRLEGHLARIKQAAAYFGFVWDEATIRRKLQTVAAENSNTICRGRWLLDSEGQCTVELHDMPATIENATIALATRAFEANGPFVGMKTTWRGHYDAFLPTDPDVFDTLLYDGQGHLTETCRANIVLDTGNKLVTPQAKPVNAANLLRGVFRDALLRENTIEERALTLDDLAKAKRMWVINSLREWTTVARVVNARGEVVMDFNTH